jgi:hypothetical protein
LVIRYRRMRKAWSRLDRVLIKYGPWIVDPMAHTSCRFIASWDLISSAVFRSDGSHAPVPFGAGKKLLKSP